MFDVVITKIILLVFLRHGVVFKIFSIKVADKQCKPIGSRAAKL